MEGTQPPIIQVCPRDVHQVEKSYSTQYQIQFLVVVVHYQYPQAENNTTCIEWIPRNLSLIFQKLFTLQWGNISIRKVHSGVIFLDEWGSWVSERWWGSLRGIKIPTINTRCYLIYVWYCVHYQLSTAKNSMSYTLF